MSKKKLPQPHDCLFRRSMEEIQIARDWFQANLPKELLAQMDLSTLTLANSDFVLEGLERLQDDCVYRCQINGSEGYIVTVVEHQSTAQKMMAFRTLQYEVAIMGSYSRQGKKLPVVVSLVLYHGVETPYPYSTDIWDCFETPELAKQWSLKPFRLVDLTVLSDEEIEKHGLASVMETLLKHSREEQVLWWLKKMIATGKLTIIYSKLGKTYVKSVGTYLVDRFGSEKHPEELEEAITLVANAVPDMREEIMTFAQQLEQRGLQQGLQQGEQRGERNKALAMAKKMLARGDDIRDIEELTELSFEEISQLRLH